MNRRVYLVVSIGTLAIVFLFSVILGSYRDRRLLVEVDRLFESRTSVYLRHLTETLRNDLLQENYRAIRNRLASARDEMLFSEYSIEKDGRVVEHSALYSKISQSKRMLLTTISIPFSEERGEEWGKVHFLTSKDELERIRRGLQIDLLLGSTLLAVAAVLVIALFLIMFWRSGSYLGDRVEAMLLDRPTRATGFGGWLWSPLLIVLERTVASHKSISRELENSRWDREMGQLAARLAHDIRSPLSVLRMLVASGPNRQESSSGEVVKQAVAEAIRRIDGIASDLLAQRRAAKSNNTTVSQREVADIAAALEQIVGEKRLQTTIPISTCGDPRLKESSDVEVLVPLSYSDCTRIVANLLQNAIEATDSDSGQISVGLRRYANTAEVMVIDNGCGIPAKLIDRLGVDEITLGKIEGNGLGVTSVRAIIDRVGGSLKFNSTEGRGTVVTVTLPLVK